MSLCVLQSELRKDESEATRMAEMSPDQKKYYEEIAKEHVDWMCEKVIKPNYILAFLHGAKHGREDVEKENRECTKA